MKNKPLILIILLAISILVVKEAGGFTIDQLSPFFLDTGNIIRPNVDGDELNMGTGDILNTTTMQSSQFNIDNDSTVIARDGSSNMTFTDTVTGLKTLAELASGGGGEAQPSTPGGVNGQVQYNNNGVLGGSSFLYYNDATDRVGIGENNPSSILEVTTAGGSDPYFYITSGSTPGNIFSVLNNGNVGIGIVAPDGTLHIHTATAGVVTPSTNADDLIVENSDNGGISILTPNNKISRIFFGSPEDPTGSKIQWDNTNDIFTLGSSKAGASTAIRSGNDVEAIRIDSSQNVGIGDTSPDYKLEVLDTNTQLTLTYVDNTETRFFVDVNGDLHIEPTGGDTFFTGNVRGTFIGDITGDLTGNATTATALAANGGNCSAGSYPLGVDASGAIEDCTDASTEIDSIVSTHAGVNNAHQALVTVSGTPNYITLSGQDLIRAK